MEQEQKIIQKNKDIYQHIFQKQQINLKVLQTQYSHHFSIAYLLLTIIFKLILVMHFQIETYVDNLLGIFVSTQILLIMIVVDFWFTKNVSGRGLVGLKWFFNEDPHGVQRFMYEARINPQYIHWIYKRMFWFIQVTYVLLGYIDINTIMSLQYNLFNVSIISIIVAIGKIITSIVNLFMFYKVYSDFQDKRQKIIETYGYQFVCKLGEASMVVYF